MPMYEYECTTCNEVFEAITSVAQRDTHRCPECDGVGHHKILTAPRLDNAKMGLDPSFPSAYAQWRVRAERRGRGEDMTAANRSVEDDTILRTAHAERKARGSNRITVS